MLKQLLLGSAMSLYISGQAQITVTDNDFPGGGDTAMISLSLDFSADYTTTGANATWDYSGLTINTQRIDTFHNIWSAPITYQAIFNNFITDPDYAADFYADAIGFDLSGAGMGGITAESPVVFTKLTSSEYQNVGIGINLNGINVPAKAELIDVMYELPMNYTDAWVSNSYINMDLNPAFNGIYRRYTDRTSVVDGWGQITTPYGTFDVLRVKSELDYTDSVYVDFGGGGSWFEAPSTDQVEYTWIANGQKVPILKIVTDNGLGGEVITRIEFKDFDRGLSSVEENSAVDLGFVFPIPATETVNLMLDPQAEKYEVYSISGELILQETVSSQQVIIDVSSWIPGSYLIKIVGSDAVSMHQFIVK